MRISSSLQFHTRQTVLELAIYMIQATHGWSNLRTPQTDIGAKKQVPFSLSSHRLLFSSVLQTRRKTGEKTVSCFSGILEVAFGRRIKKTRARTHELRTQARAPGPTIKRRKNRHMAPDANSLSPSKTCQPELVEWEKYIKGQRNDTLYPFFQKKPWVSSPTSQT